MHGKPVSQLEKEFHENDAFLTITTYGMAIYPICGLCLIS